MHLSIKKIINLRMLSWTMVQLCYSTSSGQLPEFSAMFFFLLQAKVQEYYKQMNDLVSDTYSEEDQQIIGCPSIQQVSTSTVLLQLLNECKYLWYLINRKWWKLKKVLVCVFPIGKQYFVWELIILPLMYLCQMEVFICLFISFQVSLLLAVSWKLF